MRLPAYLLRPYRPRSQAQPSACWLALPRAAGRVLASATTPLLRSVNANSQSLNALPTGLVLSDAKTPATLGQVRIFARVSHKKPRRNFRLANTKTARLIVAL